jgi:hypothetical protein
VTGVDVRACIECCTSVWMRMVGRDVTDGGEGKGCRGEAFVHPRFITSNTLGTQATSLYAIDVELDLVVSGNSCRRCCYTSPRITFTTTSHSTSVNKERFIRPTCGSLCSGEMEGWPFRRGELVNRARSWNPGHFRSII